MSGVVLEEERVKGVLCHSVAHPACLSMLAGYRKLLLSAYGPKGNSVLISNAAGVERLASSSSEIVKELSFAHPTVKFINALISAQNTSCGLNGLYTGLVCVWLLEEALRCEEDLPHPVVSCISEWITSELLDQLGKSPCQVVMELDIGDMDQVVSFVKTILGAKNCLGVTGSDADDLSINIVRAFIKSIPHEYSSSGFGHVSIVAQEEGPSSQGCVFEGLLYRDPDVSPVRMEKVGALSEINVLLFNVALSYMEGTAAVCWRGSGTKEENFLNVVLANLTHIVKKRSISIIANQKPIHPVIKHELERVECLVLERLGTNATEALVKVSGCRPITNLNNLHLELNSAVLGKLTSVQHVVFNGKDYILLDHDEGCVSTLLLPVASPSILSTLKETSESCLAALRMAVVDGKVVCGGGCLETWAATMLTQLITANIHHLTHQASSPPHHIFKVGNIFIRVLMELALHLSGGSQSKFEWSVDSVFHHLWHTPPQISREDGAGHSKSPLPPSLPQHCVCGLVKQEVVRYKHNGWWHPVEFQLPDILPGQSSQGNRSERGRGTGELPRVTGEAITSGSPCSSERCESDSESLGQCIEVDSLEGSRNSTEEEQDSLEKTPRSQEEEMDSLEGKLEALDVEGYDSLDDILDRYIKPQKLEERQLPEARLKKHQPGALYDSFPAKFNAVRLALEGFAQLLHIGQCVFDK